VAGSDEYRRVKQLVSAALEAAPEDRAALLERLAPDDGAARARATELLAQEAPARGFLEQPLLFPEAHLAGYRLLRLVGQGGSSLVFEAEQTEPRRRVALKVLVSDCALGAGARDERWRRFRAEGELLARLDHPGIARVIEAGTVHERDGATAYLAVEWVEGARALTEHVREEALELRARLGLLLEVCDAVAHAHGRGVVHRDLKPGNVLVDGVGRPRVIDFGVAHLLDDAADSTRRTIAGEFLGTLAYASPEQCSADPSRIGPATDVHALGVLLYELVCDRHPFELERLSMAQALACIQEHPPRRPTLREGALHSDLEAVMTKALAKDPRERYLDAGHFAEDLRRHLSGLPVEARSRNLWADARLFVRRHRLASRVALGAVILTVLVSVGLLRFLARQAEREVQARVRSQASTDLVTSLLALANPREHVPGELDARSLLDAASRHLAETPALEREVAAELHMTLGNAYRELGVHEPSVTHAEQALALHREEEELGPARHVGILNITAHALVDAGRLERALELLREALTLEERNPEVPRIFRAITSSHLARVRLAQGELERAEQRASFALDTYRAELGPRHRSVPRALNTLVGVHLERGEAEEARPLAELAVELDLECYGAGSLLVARSRLALARVLRALGETEEAAAQSALAEKALRRLLPPEHPERRAAEELGD